MQRTTLMTKYIYTIILTLTMLATAPATACAVPYIDIMEQEQPISVGIIGDSNLHVQNANGLTLYVYNVAGVIVQTIKVTGVDFSCDLNLPKGCYIIKVGKVVRKVSVK